MQKKPARASAASRRQPPTPTRRVRKKPAANEALTYPQPAAGTHSHTGVHGPGNNPFAVGTWTPPAAGDRPTRVQSIPLSHKGKEFLWTASSMIILWEGHRVPAGNASGSQDPPVGGQREGVA